MVIETYYRKRSKNAQQPITQMDQRCQKEPKRGSSSPAAQSAVLTRRHHVPPPPSSDFCSHLFNEFDGEGEKSQMKNHISVGCLYEVDHIHLPPRTPVHLRSVRVAMVTERTDANISVRYPSVESLRAFFRYTTRETHPTLDEKFVMGKELAMKVLSRLVPIEVYSEQKSLESFWLMTSSDRDSDSFEKNGAVGNKKGGCLSALKCNGIVGWGVRKQVKYLERHKYGTDVNGQNSSSRFVDELSETHMSLVNEDETEEEDDDDRSNGVQNGEENVEEDDDMEEERDESEREEDGSDDEKIEEEEGDEEEEPLEKKIVKETGNNILKRKRYPLRDTGSRKKQKNKKFEKKKQKKTQPKKNKNTRFKEALTLRNPKDRWSAERYKLAEQNLLEVMKAKEATFGKPLLRPQLRSEARKFIGDTGLLDHLLKHMAGKLAPGGELRFRRRHNADGAMEYWLESADLVNIRKDAGVSDPYWVPPPGWKLGDSPTQDPMCASQLKVLKDDNSRMKKELSRMKSAMEKMEGELQSWRRKVDRKAITTISIPSGSSQKFDQIASLLTIKSGSEKEKLKELLVRMFYDFAEEKICKAKLVESPVGKSELIVAAEVSTDNNTYNKQKKQLEVNESAAEKQHEVQQAFMMVKDQNPQAVLSAEEKAAKIQRLKSGFRICKPQGTFLWPNMSKNSNNSSSNNSCMAPPQVTVQVEVPTPPSVSSSSALAPPLLPYLHHHHPPPSPVKPLAERRAVTVTVSTVTGSFQNYDQDGSKNYSSSTTAMLNLNESPIPNPSSLPLLSSTAANTNPWETADYGLRNAMACDQMKPNNGCCSSSASSLAPQVGNWLALSSLKSASDESSHGS